MERIRIPLTPVPNSPNTAYARKLSGIYDAKFPDRLEYLKNMGFEEKFAFVALEKTNYDVQEAVKILRCNSNLLDQRNEGPIDEESSLIS